MKRIMCVLAAIVVAFVLTQPIIAEPTIVVRHIGNVGVVSVSEPVRGIGFEIVGNADVTVDPEFTVNVPALIKKTGTGTSVGVYSKDSVNGTVATVTGTDQNWLLLNAIVFNIDGKSARTSVRYVNPNGFRLAQNYPNPFNPSTEIRYELDENGPVNLAIYDVLGQRIATVVSGIEQAGIHTARWNATDDNGNRVTSGAYFCRLERAGMSETRRMILLK